ncbi:oleosin L-like [Rutidosis leptorrhynchoides]|uniref:oleosin L-like n=1 Tax=Rutidosis leptorrhynchoides TaxID=125765 RepID=UPI003A9A17DE
MQHGYQQHNQHEQHWGQSKAHQIAKAATAVTAGGSLLVLSGLTLAGTVIALTVATPLLVIFSPVLVPAVITVFILTTGFLTSGGLGIAAATVLAWMYRYVTGRHPTGADSLDEATHKLGSKAREFRDRSEHAMGGGGGGVGGHYGTHHTTGTGVGHH